MKHLVALHIGVWHILPKATYKKLYPKKSTFFQSTQRFGHNASEVQKIVPAEDAHHLLSKAAYEKTLREGPVVIYLHGNAGNRALPIRVDTYKILSGADVGVNVLAIDYRGIFIRQSRLLLSHTS